MQFAGIFHKTSEQMSYALNENELIVNLRTGYDVRRVFIHYGDPFESGTLAETRNGPERERKSVLRNVCVTSSGGQRHWFQSINAANIILNYIQRKKSGIILRMDF